MSADLKKMPPQEEVGGSKIELRTSSGTVICLNFSEKDQVLPKIIRLVDPEDTDHAVVFRSEDGVYHELDSDSASNLPEFQHINHCHHFNCDDGNEQSQNSNADVRKNDDRLEKQREKLQKKLRERKASNKEDDNCNGHCHQVIQLPIKGLKQYVRVNSPGCMNGESKTNPSKDDATLDSETDKGQCRQYKRCLGPKHVRELEGTLTHEARGTLGIIVTECGYSKDAYGVFKGSLYPIALTTLKGYSDEVLQWFFDQENIEKHGSTNQESAESDLAHSVHYTSAKGHSLRDTQIVDRYVNSHHLEMNEEGEVNTKELNDCLGQHPATVQEKVKSTFSPKCINNNGNPELSSCLGFDECNYLKARQVDDGLLRNDFTDIDDNVAQSANSNISDLGSGVFTMFELNPAARKLLPHLVVGMKYRRRNSKAPELFINEDNSFISLPE